MELLQRIASVIVPVFFIVAIGWAYGRRQRPDLASFSRIAMDVLSPLLVYCGLAGREFHLAAHLPLITAAVAVVLACGAVAWALARATRTQPRTLMPVVMFNNSGNMGLPLALLAFGADNFGAAVALFAITNLLQFSLGLHITSPGASARQLLLSPLMLGTALGFLSAATGIRPPELALSGMRMLGNAAIPMMLFALGVRLTGLRRADIPLGLLGAFARPMVGLLVAWPIAWAWGLDGAARAQLILYAALPPAVIQFMLAERYGREPEKVAAMILLGNALAVLFVPLGLWLALL